MTILYIIIYIRKREAPEVIRCGVMGKVGQGVIWFRKWGRGWEPKTGLDNGIFCLVWEVSARTFLALLSL